MVGADLANLVNEAALLAARREHKSVEMADFTDAVEKILLGVERRVMMTQADRERTAYHEAGHALVGMLARGRPGAQGLHHPPRHGAGRDVLVAGLGSLQLRRGVTCKARLCASRWAAAWPRSSSTTSITAGRSPTWQQVTCDRAQMVGRWGMSPAHRTVAVLQRRRGRGRCSRASLETAEP